MRITSRAVSGTYKLALGALALAGILLQMGVLDGRLNLSLLRFFTVQSNTLAAAYFLWAGLWLLTKGEGKRTRWAHVLKGIVTMNLTVTMLVAHFLLGGFPTAGGVLGASLWIVHYIVPLLTLLDWVLFDDKGRVTGREPVLWLIFPYLYLAFVTAAVGLGASLGYDGSSRYPYPFLDVQKLGLGTVAGTVAVLTAGFLLLGYVFWALDRVAERVVRRRVGRGSPEGKKGKGQA